MPKLGKPHHPPSRNVELTSKSWANQLRWEVARHAAGEEIVVYPLMEKHLGAEGTRLADEDRAEHQTVKELLYQLESLSAGTDQFDTKLKAIVRTFPQCSHWFTLNHPRSTI